jgi:hypothetical protein
MLVLMLGGANAAFTPVGLRDGRGRKAHLSLPTGVTGIAAPPRRRRGESEVNLVNSVGRDGLLRMMASARGSFLHREKGVNS